MINIFPFELICGRVSQFYDANLVKNNLVCYLAGERCGKAYLFGNPDLFSRKKCTKDKIRCSTT